MAGNKRLSRRGSSSHSLKSDSDQSLQSANSQNLSELLRALEDVIPGDPDKNLHTVPKKGCVAARNRSDKTSRCPAMRRTRDDVGITTSNSSAFRVPAAVGEFFVHLNSIRGGPGARAKELPEEQVGAQKASRGLCEDLAMLGVQHERSEGSNYARSTK